MEKLVLIDGNSLINRAFYAMPPLLTKDGVPTNAVYGFMNMFFKMLAEEKPTFVAVAFDVKSPTFRHELYADYKGTRKPMPDDLRPQIPLLKEVLGVMGVHTVEKAGSEADDIIGTIAKATDVPTIIYTGDRDALQLVDEQTSVYFTKRGITDKEVYDIKNFVEKTEITPAQVIQLKALMGDSSDNIPGVKGVGEKTAKDLIKQYGNIDNLYACVGELKGKLREKIEQDEKNAYLSQTLATIDVNCGVSTDLEPMRIKTPFSSAVREKFIELEFKSLARRDDVFQSEQPEISKEEVKEIIKKRITENFEFDFSASKIYITVADDRINLFDGKTEWEYPLMQTLLDDGFSFSAIAKELEPAFSGRARLITYDKKELKKKLIALGISLTAPCDDVSLMKYLADFSGGAESLNEVIEEYGFDVKTPAYSLSRIYGVLQNALKEQNVEKLYSDLELPLVDVLFDMERAGFKVDVTALNQTGEKFRQRITELESEIRVLADEQTLNVNSPKQLAEVLFDKLGLGGKKKGAKKRSTAAEVLEELESEHPIVSKILEYRRIQKLNSTYVEGFKTLIDKQTGLVHTVFNQTVTATGRLSSKEPNLQNIPVRDDEGRELRKFFVPRAEDRVIIGADYSQIELRLLAEFSKCPLLVKAFLDGRDIHSDTASKVFGVKLEDVTKQMRSSAKAVNFGIIYGISEYGLAKNLKITPQQARGYINAYFETYPEVKEYMNANVEFAKSTGYAKTYLGRRRMIRELSSAQYTVRSFGERVAMNMPLQGSSADIIKIAMLGVYQRLKKENLSSRLILQVHDELIVDALKDEAERVKLILKEEMEGAVNFTVPLTVDINEGKTWFDAK